MPRASTPPSPGSRRCCTWPEGPKSDDVATANLMRAAARAEVRHVVLISVVGAEAMPLGYFRAKAGAEHAVTASGVPRTTIRVAQVDTLVPRMVEALARLPFVIDPQGLRAQPVHADEVAARLFELALGEPAGLVPDLVGPEVHTMADLTYSYLRSGDADAGHGYRSGSRARSAAPTEAGGTWRWRGRPSRPVPGSRP